MKKYTNKITVIAIIVGVLIVAFLAGEDLPKTASDAQSTYSVDSETAAEDKIVQENLTQHLEQTADSETGVNKTDSDSKNVDAPKTEVIEETVPKLTCTLSVRCDAILQNSDKLNPEKQELVPKSGVLYQTATVEFFEGESVFDVLLREMKKQNIHIEFVYTPAFDSVYIEGIGNIYEFDCGDMSGWLYKVNGKVATCGSSQYILSPGDRVEWIYTC